MEKSEQQQWQDIKGWFRQNALYIAIFVLLGLGGSGGWKYWQQVQLDHQKTASDLYEQIVVLSTGDDLKQARAQLTLLEKQYVDTGYPFIANLVFAKEAYRLGDYLASEEALRWMLSNTEDENIIFVASSRLARLLMDQEKAQKAQEVINNAFEHVANQNAIADLNMHMGDAYLQLGLTEAAKQFYSVAKQNLPENSSLKELIEMKLRDVSAL